MAWWQRINDAVYREYDRRVRQASLIREYGAHDDHHDDHEDEGDVVISNVPRGTSVAPPPLLLPDLDGE